MELDGRPLQILLYYDVSIRRGGNEKRGEGGGGEWKWAKNRKVEPSIYDSVIQVPLLPGGSYVSTSARNVSALQRISPRTCGE